MDKHRIVTTSWDDGDQADGRLAECLRSRAIRGTFYIPLTPARNRPMLSSGDIRTLSAEGFEVGAHTMSHRTLSGLSDKDLVEEVSICKPILEDIVGAPVNMFCYPRGRYNPRVMNVVKKAGYRGARTVRMLATRANFDPFEMPTTVQLYPHRFSAYFRNAARAHKLETVKTCISQAMRLRNWRELGETLFDMVLQNGGIWHLYGHSWEIDEMGLWEDLGALLDYVSNRKGVHYASNGEVIELYHHQVMTKNYCKQP